MSTQQRINKFWSYVNKVGPIPEHCPELGMCWEWTSYLDKYSGYGRFRIDRKRKPNAHRAIWIMINGEVPDGLEVCHKCDNRKCVNPTHLFLGTHQDNMDDMMRKGRSVNYKGEQNGSAKLTPNQIIEIRSRYLNGGVTQKQLASEFGVVQQNISWIVRGEHWK